MNELATQPATDLLPVSARRDVSIRVATMADLPFLDAMQKAHGKALGYFPTQQFQGYIEMGGVLVAHDGATTLGYCISRDRYLKRDELGVIYQLCVAPGDQRKLIGASLVREVFNRSAYGCRLYCCWCAQDLSANYFWESLGFVPIAFRGGSSGKKRVHIFWQRRIREGDTATPWWFPAKTESGAMREDRLVLPIPPGLHWSDPMPVLTAQPDASAPSRTPKAKREMPPPRPRAVQFAPPWAKAAVPTEPQPETPKPQPKPKVKIDPAIVAKARELRDRYLEQVNDRLMLPAGGGKYDVGRVLQSAPGSPQSATRLSSSKSMPALPAA